MGFRTQTSLAGLCLVLLISAANAAPLGIVQNGKSSATIVVAEDAGTWEKKAAEDLAKYIELMSGAKLTVANQLPGGTAPALIVGQAALKADPSLNAALKKAAKPNPVLRSDAIVLRRNGNRVYIAGNNDESHYYAASALLQQWGCRWYLPTEFGECIPEQKTLTVDELDLAYGSPFEARRYWISWVGDNTGADEFKHRNFMNNVMVPNGHILGKYTKALVPKGKSVFNVPITADTTAQHVAEQVAPLYEAGKPVQLGIEDGVYQSDDPLDKQLIALQYDKYFMTQSVTDAFLVFYNKVADILMKKYPKSDAKIGFLAYANLTMPPVKDITAKKPLVAYLAPIDIDPIHHMDDPRSLPRREYKEMLYKWAEVMQGRVVIYDYDQGMLVWRDVPAPSHQMIRHDIKHYQKAGILGIDTESRNAIATIFTNLFFRGQLMWDPDVDVDALLAEFYPKFYGPAAEPMSEYWGKIYQAWEDSIVTEHEYMVIPAIYTPELMQALGQDLAKADAAIQPLAKKAKPTRNEQLYLDRIKFMRLSYGVLKHYTDMIHAAATEVDYAAAVKAGQQGLTDREALTEMNGTFTTYKNYGERGPAWWPGEVAQYEKLAALTGGTDGKLLKKLPLEWAFRRDPQDVGVKQNWATQPVDLTYWNGLENKGTLQSHIDNPGHWEMLRTDLYIQAQGVLGDDYASYTGHGWYRTDLDLKPQEAQGGVHLYFPGLFNECWLYVNGREIAHREQGKMWWLNSYEFSWDVDLTGQLKPGQNVIALRFNDPHHFGGMFRRPFLYRPVNK